jgi:DNA-binding CsgD family transcriptional regulator
MDEEPFYSEFLRPRGFGWCVGTTIRSPSDDALVFSVERLHAKGPVERDAVERLNGLRPHLARAAILSARFGLERAHASVETLQMLGLPAAVLARSGKALAMNRLMEQRAPQLPLRAGDTLRLTENGAHRLFSQALTQGPARPDAARSIPILAVGDQGPAVAHLLPIRGAALDIFSGASWLLFMTPLNRTATGLGADLLQALFDLSPAEARVTRLLLDGRSVAAVAAATGVGVSTVRAHLKAIFAKTGVHRQAELVCLLALPSY